MFDIDLFNDSGTMDKKKHLEHDVIRSVDNAYGVQSYYGSPT